LAEARLLGGTHLRVCKFGPVSDNSGALQRCVAIAIHGMVKGSSHGSQGSKLSLSSPSFVSVFGAILLGGSGK